MTTNAEARTAFLAALDTFVTVGLKLAQDAWDVDDDQGKCIFNADNEAPLPAHLTPPMSLDEYMMDLSHHYHAAFDPAWLKPTLQDFAAQLVATADTAERLGDSDAPHGPGWVREAMGFRENNAWISDTTYWPEPQGVNVDRRKRGRYYTRLDPEEWFEDSLAAAAAHIYGFATGYQL